MLILEPSKHSDMTQSMPESLGLSQAHGRDLGSTNEKINRMRTRQPCTVITSAKLFVGETGLLPENDTGTRGQIFIFAVRVS